MRFGKCEPNNLILLGYCSVSYFKTLNNFCDVFIAISFRVNVTMNYSLLRNAHTGIGDVYENIFLQNQSTVYQLN